MSDTVICVLWWVLGIAGLVLVNILASYLIISSILFNMHLKRKNKDTWTRGRSTDAPEQVVMYDEGDKWSENNQSVMQELHIVNEGFNIYAEYYQNGGDKAVIIIPGRTEGLKYGYYFAKPYWDMGYSVLTIDQRAHGESDGKYNTLGTTEHRDVLAWAKLLKTQYGIKTIVLHGICIGSACGLYACVSENNNGLVDGLVAEGMFQRFYESFKNHMIEMNKPVRPCIDFVDMWIRLINGHSMKRGPIDVMHKMTKPFLMLNSVEDKYSVIDKAKELYEACPSENKHIEIFPHGGHSLLRITDTQKYDDAVKKFLSENYK